MIEDADLLGVWVEPVGLPDTQAPEDALADILEDQLENKLTHLKPRDLASDDVLEETTTRLITRNASISIFASSFPTD